uniref:RING-type domain-containing protein n=1 Tax=Caenorhabditis japonica TaxID=281687 RepID=A0A8R1DHZ2_CAEJA
MGDCDGAGPSMSPTTSSIIPNPPELQCTICLSTRFTNESRIDGCAHSFCFSCISEWVCSSIRPSCPMCRKDVEKVCYDFEQDLDGRMEIGILEFRSGHMSLTPTDKAQLLSERRFVVRNMMHTYKVLNNVHTVLTDEVPDEEKELKKALNDLSEILTKHIGKAEMILAELRSEPARRNKALVFSNPTFRRMVYSVRIRVKYPDQKRPKLQPADLVKDPERFRKIIVDFLVKEFDVIPLFVQPMPSGIRWRTKFFGSAISIDEKMRYANEIYALMLINANGTATFQNELLGVLPQVGAETLQLLDDHLEAILAIEKTDLTEFYNSVYYDSVYNNLGTSFLDFGGLNSMRDDRHERLEAIFQHIHRDIGAADWGDVGRLRRQTSNTNGTDRATNNDDSSSHSSGFREESPPLREDTPMPDIEPIRHEDVVVRSTMIAPLEQREVDNIMASMRNRRRAIPGPSTEERDLASRYRNRDFRPRRMRDGQDESVEAMTSRTLPFSAHSNRLRSLRRSARRDRQLEQAERQVRPVTRRDDRDDLNPRVRELEEQSQLMAEMFRRQPPFMLFPATEENRMTTAPRIPVSLSATNAPIPVYQPGTTAVPRRNPEGGGGEPTNIPVGYISAELFSGIGMDQRYRESALQMLRANGVTMTSSEDGQHHIIQVEFPPLAQMQRMFPSISAEAPHPQIPENGLNMLVNVPPVPSLPETSENAESGPSTSQQNVENAESVARRTRAARRAAASLPGAPPTKRAPNSD